jgi:hypothetical protein
MRKCVNITYHMYLYMHKSKFNIRVATFHHDVDDVVQHRCSEVLIHPQMRIVHGVLAQGMARDPGQSPPDLACILPPSPKPCMRISYRANFTCIYIYAYAISRVANL